MTKIDKEEEEEEEEGDDQMTWITSVLSSRLHCNQLIA